MYIGKEKVVKKLRNYDENFKSEILKIIEGGYNFKFIPFEIDIDIIKTYQNIMGTFAEGVINGKRL